VFDDDLNRCGLAERDEEREFVSKFQRHRSRRAVSLF